MRDLEPREEVPWGSEASESLWIAPFRDCVMPEELAS